MTLLAQPPEQHHCGPNKYGVWLKYSYDNIGTVRGCECGKTWVAISNPDMGACYALWREEGALARWFRERKQKKRGGTQ